jgi:hypothetical protein
MTNITQVSLTAGVPTGPAGAATVSTLDNLIGVAGTPSTQVQSVQGVSGGTALPVSAASLPLPTGAALETGGNLATIAAVSGTTSAAAVITDATGTVQQYLRGLVKLIAAGINVVITNANSNGRAIPANSAPVVLNSQTYKSCPVSATTLLGATGATGDYLDGVLIIPGAAAAGIVQIQDGSGTAITIFAGGGTTALPTLAPFYVPVGAVSSGGSGGWKVITNASVTALGVGNFT